MSDRILKESDVLKIAFQLSLVVNSAFADAVKALPSADRLQEWIPCSERLPSEDGQYLVWAIISFVPDHVDDPSTYQGITIAGYYGNAHPINWFGTNVEKVIAWMPLPEPWKGAENKKECHKPESLYYRAYCEERKDSAYCDGCEFWY